MARPAGSGVPELNTPYVDLVPKDIDANLAFRADLIQQAATDVAFRRELWSMCARDLLFYVNFACWTFDPRKRPSIIPFITWDYQDKGLERLFDSINSNDVLIEKSRDMGASWLILTVFQHSWQFLDLCTFLMVSRNEDLVDKPDDPDSLFWKVDFLLEHQPKWMRPRLTRTSLKLLNEDTGSTIIGASTTSETSRGGRKTAILFDEFAAVTDGAAMLSASRDNTNSRFFNSTPQGMGNAFYQLIQKGEIERLRFHWTQHPEKAAGLYRDKSGRERSPWYDLQCKRAGHAVEIAQELDIDYVGSGYQFYDAEAIRHHISTYSCDPYSIGDLAYSEHDCVPIEFRSHPKGTLKLWLNVHDGGRPPADGEYVIGADIATGTGASNSSLSIGNRITREKVGKYVTPNLRPEGLAKIAVALARWFNGAQIIPEATGPGRNFIDAVLETGYRNLWWKRNEESLDKKQSMIPGWHATKSAKIALHGDYRKALGSSEVVPQLINRDMDALNECHNLVFTPAGGVEHVSATNTIDPTGAKDNHSDTVTSDALMWKGMKEFYSEMPQRHALESPNTLGARMEFARQRELARSSW